MEVNIDLTGLDLPTDDQVPVKGKAATMGQWFETTPSPVIAGVMAAFATLLVAFANAVASWWFTPRTMRKIAADQLEVSDRQIEVANKSAASSATSAAAAARSAEVAAINSVNTGIHEVARLRQEWIDKLRVELSELHSAFMDWSGLSLGASLDEADAYRARVRTVHARLANVRLLLNPRETASKQLLSVLDSLSSLNPTIGQRKHLCRWLIKWAQIVLKTEWDRVRRELDGSAKPMPFRRAERR